MENVKDQKAILRTIFVTFFKIGLFTFGGGYAMIPLIEYEVVERHHWIESKDILDIIAIAGATPGVLSVNTVTFVGYRVAGVAGALVGTIGMIIPSYVIICIIAIFYQQFKSLEWVGYAFGGIRAGVIVLLIGAVVEMGKKSEYTSVTVFILVIAFILATFTEINIIFLLLGGALIGIIYQLTLRKKFFSQKKEEDNE